jgi:hypothetical protein
MSCSFGKKGHKGASPKVYGQNESKSSESRQQKTAKHVKLNSRTSKTHAINEERWQNR